MQSQQPVPESLKAAITDVVITDGLAGKIRAKARDDHADELDRAGYTDAAAYLRRTR